MRMQGERAYGRCPACDDWEEIDDFRGALLPGSDMMVYLLPALGLAAAVYRLAERFCRCPVEAALFCLSARSCQTAGFYITG